MPKYHEIPETGELKEYEAGKECGHNTSDEENSSREEFDLMMQKLEKEILETHNKREFENSILKSVTHDGSVATVEYTNGEVVTSNISVWALISSEKSLLREIAKNKTGYLSDGIKEDNGMLDKDFIDSSFLLGATYSKGLLLLELTNKGKIRMYLYRTTEPIAREFMMAENKGQYFNEKVKNNLVKIEVNQFNELEVQDTVLEENNKDKNSSALNLAELGETRQEILSKLLEIEKG